MEHFGDVLVVGEQGNVVGGDGEDVTLEGAQHLYDEHGHGLGVLAFRELCHEEFLCGALDQCDDGALAVIADDGVHIPVAEAGLCVNNGGTQVDAHAVLYRRVRAHG